MTGTREEFDSEAVICAAMVNEQAQRGGRPRYSSSLIKGSSTSSSGCSSTLTRRALRERTNQDSMPCTSLQRKATETLLVPLCVPPLLASSITSD
ncbi:hypothetical protein VPH35_083084 [Triticum aestivum]